MRSSHHYLPLGRNAFRYLIVSTLTLIALLALLDAPPGLAAWKPRFLFSRESSPMPLGNYANTSVQLGANTTITPSAAPTATTSINVSTSTNFKGKLEGNPTTGVVRVTDAHPAGSYTLMVTAFDGEPSTKMFTLTVTTPAACNPVTFSMATSSGVGSNPPAIAIGDFNGDGYQDLATANTNSNNLSVLLGDGAGGFGAAAKFDVGREPVSVAVGDFNGDGNQDLAASNLRSGNVSILLGNGAGGFSAAFNFDVGSVPLTVTVGDFNRDSKQDLAVANFNSGNVSVLLGDGGGSFGAAKNFGVGSGPRSVAVGDFNGDGNQDLTTVNQMPSNLSVLLGDGAGGFGAAITFVVGATPESVAVGDFNGDGNQDLATANFSSSVSVLLGNGAGSFSAAANFDGGTNSSSVAVGDFNADDKQDLAVANFNSGNVSVLVGDGAGGFGAATNFGTGTGPNSVAVGDFNGDHQQDLAIANFNSNNVSVLLGSCQPTMRINDVIVTEGDGGTVNAAFSVSLSRASEQTVTVNYATADGTATAGSDYQAISATTLTFNPGVTSLTVNVSVIGDTLDEPNETFSVDLSGATNATIADNQGVGTITDDDPLPNLSISDVSQVEGNSGTTSFNFNVSLSTASGQTVTVNYATADGTATAGSDYQNVSSTLTFNPGVTSLTVNVPVIGDTLDEPNETFSLNLSGATNATIADNQGVGTITDDDPLPNLSISDVSQVEGNSGTTSFNFRVSLLPASRQTVTVNYATADGTGTSGSDYQGIGFTALTFTPGEISKTVTVLVNGDTAHEPNETFFVNLSGATNANITNNQGQGTITNDDPLPTLSINDVSVIEGNGGTVNAVFTVSLSTASGQAVTVNYATADGTAAAGVDYQAISSTTLTFNPGEINKPITIVIVGDILNEADETVFVNLTNAINAIIAGSPGVGTITNDDLAGTLAISGQITDAGNNPLPDVNVMLSGLITREAKSDVNGNYSFPGLASSGNYAVTVQSAYYVFATSRREFLNLISNQTANFVAVPVAVAAPPALSDDFNDTKRDPDKWTLASDSQAGLFDARVKVVQEDGRLVITPLSPRESGRHYNGYVSAKPLDFSNGTAAVEVVQAATDGADTIFAIGKDSNNLFRFMVHTADAGKSLEAGAGNSLVAGKSPNCSEVPQSPTLSCLLLQVVTAGQLNSVSVSYDPVQHRFIRFRHVLPTPSEPETSIVFEASPDDIRYTILQRTLFEHKPLDPLRIELSAGTTRNEGSNLTNLEGAGALQTNAEPAKFDNVKVSPVPPDPGNFRIVLAPGQVTIKTWTLLGRTYVYLIVSFPDAGYRVASWGQPVGTVNDFSADAAVEKFTGGSVQAVTTTAQIYDLGPLANGNYLFTFKNSGVAVKSQSFTVMSSSPSQNPIDNAREFVKRQYRDFLNREADQGGEDFWTANITRCSDSACIKRQREITSGAFFLSPEFQSTGYYVYRMYQGALGRQPKLSEFTPDAQLVGAGIVVNGQLSAAKINQNKAAFAQQFVNCTDSAKYRCGEFKAIFDGLSNQLYVDKLFQTTGVNASALDRTALVNGLNGGTETRASVLQKVVDGIVVISEGNQQFTTTYGHAFYDQQFNRAFVQLEYFGYMKRDPDDGGYAFWLNKLNTAGGNFVKAEMVLAFISSPEYRARFGQP